MSHVLRSVSVRCTRMDCAETDEPIKSRRLWRTLTPSDEYDRMRCGLMTNYLDHLLNFYVIVLFIEYAQCAAHEYKYAMNI